MKVSPFAPERPAELPALSGIRLAVAEAGIRYRNRKDVLLVILPEGTQVAGVLTRSRTASAPVDWCRDKLGAGRARALVVNSGNANAFTGMRGQEIVATTAALAAEAIRCDPSEVFLASTGVIGEPIPPGRFDTVIGRLASEAIEDGFADAARTIMTTDTFPKLATRKAEIGGASVTLNGIAKGSGMIAPDMATMLGFIFTDAAVTAPALQTLLSRHVETTFNSITVDSDTSTSDTLLAFATGTAAKNGPWMDRADDPALGRFSEALCDLMRDLALQIIKDGEGITKLITVHVDGAEGDAAAKRIALSIANSPLVKTAIAGEDANWGRVVAAIGKASETANRDRLAIWFGDLLVAKDGMRNPDYTEAEGSAYMKNAEIVIRTDAGTDGPGRATVWGCDLTHGYIDINGSYRS